MDKLSNLKKEANWYNWQAREKIYHLKCKEPFGQAIFN